MTGSGLELYEFAKPWDGAAVGATTIRERVSCAGFAKALFHFDWTGDPTGTLTILTSDHEDPSTVDDSDWLTHTADPDDPAGGAGKSGVQIDVLAARWLMVKYAGASGSGTLTARVTLKR